MKRIFIFLLTAFSISSCQKRDDNEIQIPLDDEVKAYFDFKPGTYWIMKDSLTGITDSFVVTQRTSLATQEGNGVNEVLNFDISDYPLGGTLQGTSGFEMGLWNGFSVAMYFGSSKMNYILCSQFTLDSMYGHLEAEGRVYDSVLRYTRLGLGPDQIHEYGKFYFNREVGFIKMELNHNTEVKWHLLRFNIIR